jgi:hypothetical protein
MALFASPVASPWRVRQLQCIDRQQAQVCARLAVAALATVARTQAISDECGQAN